MAHDNKASNKTRLDSTKMLSTDNLLDLANHWGFSIDDMLGRTTVRAAEKLIEAEKPLDKLNLRAEDLEQVKQIREDLKAVIPKIPSQTNIDKNNITKKSPTKGPVR